MKLEDIKDGMLLQVRDGTKYYYIKDRMFRLEDRNKHNYYRVNGFYDADLKCVYDNNFDIMKIYYMDELLWERKTDWSKVPFGTKVIVWSGDKRSKQTGRFLHYDEKGTWLKFLIFIEDTATTKWFEYCELLDGGDIVG